MLLSDCFGSVRHPFTSKNPTNAEWASKIRWGTVSRLPFRQPEPPVSGQNTCRLHFRPATISTINCPMLNTSTDHSTRNCQERGALDRVCRVTRASPAFNGRVESGRSGKVPCYPRLRHVWRGHYLRFGGREFCFWDAALFGDFRP